MTDYNIAYSELTDTYYITQNGKKVSDCTNQIQSIVEAEHSAMCESCIHKVSADDIEAIRNSAIDEFVEMLTNEWGLDIILAQSNKAKLKSFIVSNADQMKGE